MVKDFKHFELYGHRIFSKAIVKAPFRMIASMQNEACFYYVVSGSAGVITSSEKFELQPEEGLLMQCGNYINDYLESKKVEACEAIGVHFNAEVLKLVYDKDFPDFLFQVGNVKSIGYEKVRTDAIMKSYIENLKFYFDNPDLVSEELLRLKLKELILLLAKTNNVEKIRLLIKSLFVKDHVGLKETVELNIFTQISIKELAFLCNLSLSTFKRKFYKIFNQSPAKYIKLERLKRAAMKLRMTNERISDIAYDCGFSELAHFSRSFSDEYHQSPSEYRMTQIDK